MKKNNTPLLGAHISGAGGLYHSFERALSIGCTAFQLFTKSNRSWFGPELSQADINCFKQAQKKSTITNVIVHAGYLINIGSSNQETATQSTKSLLHEIKRCEQLDIKTLVLHPGAHVGQGYEACIEQVAKNLDYVIHNSNKSVSIALENMAGQGTTIGHTFQQLQSIRNQCNNATNIGFCLDTCHLFAAGYHLSSALDYEALMHDAIKILGLETIIAIHVNDSMTPYNSHKDRHAPIGKGSIPLTVFSSLINDQRFANIPKILETPSDTAMLLWKNEIKLLLSMINYAN